jgi:hypothetical protein
MKRYVPLLLCLALCVGCLALAACGAPAQPPTESTTQPPAATQSPTPTADDQETTAAPKQTPASAGPAFDIAALFQRLEGYWNGMGSKFVCFEYRNNRPFVSFGIWDSEGSGCFEVTGGQSTGKNKVALTIFIPAFPGDEAFDAHPERTETVDLDLTALERDGKIAVQRDSRYGGGDTYTYGGATQNEAYAAWYNSAQ